ncbi:MAG: hypothetical protein J6P95_02085 [Paludibacteraceae bacterium]|nr:hypothetical protein [Paludibacteraceae bacterium]
MKTKYLIAILFVATLATSCTMVKQTARIENPASYINTATIADLDISNKPITFTYEPSKAVRKGGNDNIVKTAVQEALKANGNGDILVALQWTAKYKSGKIHVISIKGYPATYKNFRNLPDSIWGKTPIYQPSTFIDNSTSSSSSLFFSK